MGRFYKTTRATFVPNSIYTPPIELMQKAIALNEQRVDKALAQTDLFQNAVDTIKHLDTPGQRELAKQLQEKYATPINNIVQKIHENPLDYEKYLPQMRNIQRDMMADRQSGLWRTLEGNYKAYQDWLEANKEARKTSPFEFNLANQYYLKKLDEESQTNPEATFKGGQVYSRPDVFSKKYQDILDKIKEQHKEIFSDDMTMKTSIDGVGENRVLNIIADALQNDPQYAAYMNQMHTFLGKDQYKEPLLKVVGEGKKQHIQINPENPFASDVAAVINKYAHQDIKQEFTKKGQEYWRNYYATKLAKTKAGLDGSPTDLGKSTIFVAHEATRTPEEMENLSTDYLSLLNKPKRTDADNHKLAEIGAIFDPFVNAIGDELIKAFGEDPKDYENPLRKRNKIIRILGEINKARANSDYGITLDKHVEKDDPVSRFLVKHIDKFLNFVNKKVGTDIRTSTDFSERNRITKAEDVLEESFKNFDKLLAENLAVTTTYKTFGNDEASLKLLNHIEQSYINSPPVTHIAGQTFYDSKGMARPSQRIDIDTNKLFSGSGKSGNALLRMKNLAGVKSLKDLMTEGFVQASYTPTDKGEITVLWTPTEKYKKIAQVENEAGDYLDGFKTTFNNIGFNPFENASTPDEQLLANQFKYGKSFVIASQKLSYAESLLKKNSELINKYYPKGIPMSLPGFYNVDFSIKEQPDGGFILTATNINNGKEKEITVTKKEINAIGLDSKAAQILLLMRGIYRDKDILALEAQGVGKKTKSK